MTTEDNFMEDILRDIRWENYSRRYGTYKDTYKESFQRALDKADEYLYNGRKQALKHLRETRTMKGNTDEE